LCYDRLQAGMTPACAQACPTQSIQFGNLTDMHAAADKRLTQLHQSGITGAQLYGRDTSRPNAVYGGLDASVLRVHQPEAYGPAARLLPAGHDAASVGPTRRRVRGPALLPDHAAAPGCVPDPAHDRPRTAHPLLAHAVGHRRRRPELRLRGRFADVAGRVGPA